MQRHQALKLVGEICTGLRLAPRERIGRQIMSVRKVVDTRNHRSRPHLAHRQNAADGDSAEVHAVVGTFTADQLRAGGVAAHLVIRKRDLQGGFDRLRAGVGKEDVVQAGRGYFDERVGKLERERVPHLEGGRVVHRLELVRDRFGYLRPAVSRVDAPESGDSVQDLAAFGRPIVHARSLREDPGLRLELAVCREGHPVRFKLVSRGGRRGGLGGGHGGHSFARLWVGPWGTVLGG